MMVLAVHSAQAREGVVEREVVVGGPGEMDSRIGFDLERPGNGMSFWYT